MKNQSQIYDVPQLCTESSADSPSNGSKLVVYADLHHSTNPPAAPSPAQPVVYTEATDIQAAIGNSDCGLVHQVSHFIAVLAWVYGLCYCVSHVLHVTQFYS